MHGKYVSTWTEMDHPGGVTCSHWTICPECARQHTKAAKSRRFPDLPVPHAPEYRWITTQTAQDGAQQETASYPDLTDALRDGRISRARLDELVEWRVAT